MTKRRRTPKSTRKRQRQQNTETPPPKTWKLWCLVHEVRHDKDLVHAKLREANHIADLTEFWS